MRQLERDLENDLVHSDPAVLERVRKLVKSFLLHEASLLTGTRVANEDDIVELIRMHSRVGLLRALIENPKGFTLKDQKELFRSMPAAGGGGEDKPVNPMALIDGLNVEDEVKAKLIGAMADLLRTQIRAQLPKGRP
jgi:hypothetical protein